MNSTCSLRRSCLTRAALTLVFVSGLASLTPNVARAFSISAVTLSPSNVVPPMTVLRMTIDIVTPSQGTWLYAPTQISSNATGLRVDVYPTSGPLTAIGSLRETVPLGVFPVGTHNYEVVIHPNFTVNWGTRTNRGSFTVTGEPPQPRVSIVATVPETMEPSLNTLVRPGEFTISRTGPTNGPLSVFVHYSGTATPGVDYAALPFLVTIRAGAISERLAVEPLKDGISEGVETLVATLSHCPPDTEPPLGIPCYGGFEIDPARDRATVFIRDDARVSPSLAITSPRPGANFPVGDTIAIEATASDPEGYIGRVEFWDGQRRIGVSEIVFIQAPDPGTPIYHSFEWPDAAPGAHVLTARAVTSAGVAVSSAPVPITVGTVSNLPPRIAITQPAGGAEYPPDTAVEIVVEASDPDGYVPKVEFFANARKIGEANVQFLRPPDPGQTQTFTFVWRHPTPGPHVLTARATDDRGAAGSSAPVAIRVAMSEPLPIVIVSARDAWAVEPGSNTSLNTASFRLRRFGPTNDALVVAYSLRGTAVNGTDYDTLPGLATIPAGRRSVLVTIRPLADNRHEGKETVVLRLEEPPPPSPEIRVINPYRVGSPAVAAAVISDYEPPLPPPTRPRCVALPEGFLHVCFPADHGSNYRIEATSDLRNWETLCDGLSIYAEWHFIDTEMGNHAQRFYRLTPEPVSELDE